MARSLCSSSERIHTEGEKPGPLCREELPAACSSTLRNSAISGSSRSKICTHSTAQWAALGHAPIERAAADLLERVVEEKVTLLVPETLVDDEAVVVTKKNEIVRLHDVVEDPCQ